MHIGTQGLSRHSRTVQTLIMAPAVNQYSVINNVNESWLIHFLLGYLTAVFPQTGFYSNCNTSELLTSRACLFYGEL